MITTRYIGWSEAILPSNEEKMTSQIVPSLAKILFEGKMSWLNFPGTRQSNEWEVQRKAQTNKIKKGEVRRRTVFFLNGMLKVFVILRRIFYIKSSSWTGNWWHKTVHASHNVINRSECIIKSSTVFTIFKEYNGVLK